MDSKNSFTRLSGFYRGKVLQHCQNGRCKIWIPGVYDEAWKNKPEMLPEAEQATPIFCMSGANQPTGLFAYPDVGSFVWCFFANDNQNMPVYFAGTMFSIQNELSDWKKSNTNKIIQVDNLKITIDRKSSSKKDSPEESAEKKTFAQGLLAGIESAKTESSSESSQAESTETGPSDETEIKIECPDAETSIKMNSKSKEINIVANGKINLESKDSLILTAPKIVIANSGDREKVKAGKIMIDEKGVSIAGNYVSITSATNVDVQSHAIFKNSLEYLTKL